MSQSRKTNMKVTPIFLFFCSKVVVTVTSSKMKKVPTVTSEPIARQKKEEKNVSLRRENSSYCYHRPDLAWFCFLSLKSKKLCSTIIAAFNVVIDFQLVSRCFCSTHRYLCTRSNFAAGFTFTILRRHQLPFTSSANNHRAHHHTASVDTNHRSARKESKSRGGEKSDSIPSYIKTSLHHESWEYIRGRCEILEKAKKKSIHNWAINFIFVIDIDIALLAFVNDERNFFIFLS